jgi:hypothetical protein
LNPAERYREALAEELWYLDTVVDPFAPENTKLYDLLCEEADRVKA